MSSSDETARPLYLQEMLARLQQFWSDYGCVIMQPYHTEVGAGTFNPATLLRSLGPSWAKLPLQALTVGGVTIERDGPITGDDTNLIAIAKSAFG